MERETYLSRLGADLEPGGRDPAPQPLRVIQRFVNTYNHELGDERDRLKSPASAQEWLVEHTLLESGRSLTTKDLERLRRFRERMRALVDGPGGSESPQVHDSSRELLGDLRLRVAIDADCRVRLEPSGDVVEHVAGSLLVIAHEAMIAGVWNRMKLCRQCSWLFFDHSRNCSGSWCSMSVCGNRAKNRAYRERAAE